jgi:hypothetical protein
MWIDAWCSEGCNSGRYMLVRKLWIKLIINIEVYFVGCLYIIDLINAQMIDHIKVMYVFVAIHLTSESYIHVEAF